jgi:uncharacterized protein
MAQLILNDDLPQESMMTRFGYGMRLAAVSAVAVCLAAPFAGPPAVAQSRELASSAPASTAEKKVHRLVLQVNSNEPATMNLALNNAANVEQHYKELGEKVEIEVVTFGPGLHMLRDDTSPVKDRIKAMAEKTPSISFKACGNTQENMRKAEDKTIPLLSQAALVKSGVVRVMELQEQGWTYVRP